jgi:perosamine synthetase
MRKIPVAGPWVTQREIDYVSDAATNAWYSDANRYHERFEKAFAEYIGVRFAVALPSCTAAIHVALAALGVGPGDEIVVPDLTWIATSAPVSYLGATPVFADVDPQTWCLSAETVLPCLSPRTKAIIPVDLYGQMPDYEALEQLARGRGIAIVEDAAEAIGSSLAGKRAGAFGDAGVFSFHGSKTMTTGEGGMLVTDREDLHREILILRDHGRTPGDVSFLNERVAYKYKMSALQAAFGLAQLERIDELVARKQAIFAWYSAELVGSRDLVMNPGRPGFASSYWMSTIIASARSGMDKHALIKALAAAGIDARPFFSPLSSLKAYSAHPESGRARERNANAYALSPRGVNLPSGLGLTRDDVQYVVSKLRPILEAEIVRPRQ